MRIRQPIEPQQPPPLHGLSRQSVVEDSVPRVPPSFNINSGGRSDDRFITDAGAWIVGYTKTYAKNNAQIGGAEDRNRIMYKSNRFGAESTTWGYDIPVQQPGIYNCTAHFAELNFFAFAPRQRVFNLVMATKHGERNVFRAIDIFRELNGAEFTVLTKTAFNIIVPGTLSIRLVPMIGDATLSGLTCERGADLPENIAPDYSIPNVQNPPEANPIAPTPEPPSDGEAVGTDININCGGDSIGRFIGEDHNWLIGNTSTFATPDNVEIGGAEEKNAPALLTHRYGIDGNPFGYDIPVTDRGIYECSLHFAETYAGAFFVGARTFDIDFMGNRIENVDIFKDAQFAEFTSVVKTFVELKFETSLKLTLIPRTGDAFLAAITCVKTTDLPDISLEPEESQALDATEVVLPTSTPTPGATVIESPMVTVQATPLASIIPTPSVAPGGGEVSPMLPLPSAAPIENVHMAPSPESSDEIPIPSGELGLLLASTDKSLVATDGEVLTTYFLRARVTSEIVFSQQVKEALKKVSEDSSDVESQWALTGLNDSKKEVSISRWSMRQSQGDFYDVDLQAVYKENDEKSAYDDYTQFVIDGDASKAMSEEGFKGVNIEIRKTAAANVGETTSQNTSLIVLVTVGCSLVVLALVAVIVFVAVNRQKRFSNGDFDAPPPEMSDSEGSSVLARSETGASLDYLDDDSTYTAATSRAGEHIDQVGFAKDVFGRGTAEPSNSGGGVSGGFAGAS